jgi:lipid-A-disaccharide synthase-like uncharacterized protein
MVACAPHPVLIVMSMLLAAGGAPVEARESSPSGTVQSVTGGTFSAAIGEPAARRAPPPENLAARISRTFAQVFSVSSTGELIWIAIGLLGQILFAGRMIVQWIVSEYHKRVHVPTIFWWMSLLGSSMLLSYFCWRRDPVGILGQSSGWLIYGRNLWLIYHPRRAGADRALTSDRIPAERDAVKKAA